VKTSSGKVVEESITYEITEQRRTKSVFPPEILAYTDLPRCYVNVRANHDALG